MAFFGNACELSFLPLRALATGGAVKFIVCGSSAWLLPEAFYILINAGWTAKKCSSVPFFVFTSAKIKVFSSVFKICYTKVYFYTCKSPRFVKFLQKGGEKFVELKN